MELRVLKSGGQGQGLHIFLAEDNAADVFWLEMVLKGARIPYTIDLAQDGALALQHLKKFAAEGGTLPDIILLDLYMPGATGEEILADLPAFDVPIFILSGSDVPKSVRQCLGNGRCLRKPLTNADLLASLKAVGLLENSEREAA